MSKKNIKDKSLKASFRNTTILLRNFICNLFSMFIGLSVSTFLCGCQPLDSVQTDPLKNTNTIQDLRSVPAQNPQLERFEQTQKRKIKPKPSPKFPAIFNQSVTITIGDHLPLKTALLSLSQQSGIDLQLEAGIDGKILYSAHNRPLIEVIHGICDLAHLRYTINNSSITIKKDAPYTQTYNVQFLNQNRTSSNNTSIATDIFSGSQNADGTQGNGSSSQVSAEAKNDFWEELEKNLKIMLRIDSSRETNQTTETQKTDAIRKEPLFSNGFTIHRQGGIITVNANSRTHALVNDYLNSLKKTIHTQVLIEAKVIEVNLKEEFKAGIDWWKLTKEGLQANIPLGKLAHEGKVTNPMHHQGEMLTLGFRTDHFSSILNAIQQFGSCNTLSSPRLTVLNNQNAILKVAKNQVYFRLRYDRQYNLNINRENLTVASDIQTVPIGLVMSVQPSIDQTTGKIVLSLRPTISRLSRSVADPAVDVAYAASGHHGERPEPSLIPVVDVREIDTLIETEPGKIVVLGGLMESRKAFEENKIPILGDIPLLGKLATGQSEIDEVIELVILIKCTLMNGDTSSDLDAADQRLINNFTDDPRPLEGWGSQN